MSRDKRLHGRVALIVGGGGEIGGAIARRFALEGASVLVADLRPAAAESVADDIRTAGGVAASIALDAVVERDCERAVAKAADLFGKLTTLVNVAAADTPRQSVEAQPLSVWNEALAINLTASFLTAKYAAPFMRNAGGGAIVNIASQLGHIGVPLRAAYSTTKAALIQLTKCLAVELATDNIRANTISPGSIDTERSTRSYGSRENARLIRGPAHLVGRTGHIDEVAFAAAFLASDEASFITGTDLLVDGGYLAFKGELPPQAAKT
jgi:NAD(P)-dependent dehydrogenase (short-subunit alcohol dehydrogenase family)